MTLRVQNIVKDYGHVRALQGVDLVLQPGEIRALLGGNGSGKSTLTKVLTGVTSPDGGTIGIDGAEAHVRGPNASARLGIAATYQEVALAGDLTVAENLCVRKMPTRLKFLSAPARANEVLASALVRVGLAPSILSSYVRDLDLEQRSLVELARVLAARPKYVVLDELTASLRAERVELVGEIIAELAAAGTAILFVSHRLEEIERFCTNATVLRSGRVVLDGSLSELTIEDLVTAMTGETEVADDRRRVVRATEGAGDAVLVADQLKVPGAHGPISLTLRAKTVTGIAGLSGQGQGELLRALAGTAPAEGSITVDGRLVPPGNVREFVSRGVGFVSGERDREMAFGVRSVDENARSVSLSRKKSFDVGALLSRLQLPSTHRRAAMGGLSGGQQQKVILGRWLGSTPTVLVADDPTRGIDIGARREIHRLVREVADSGSAVVLTSSDDHELAEVCDRVVVIYRGEKVAELSGTDVTEQKIADASVRSGLLRSDREATL
ncbi:sugar ABC transporter ATP-binding protein [Rhodococcus sp. IEGM 1381]|uniref:sugar ABC transporter ATP-binding protein n=1 Tax=Rhodococcus sp. IEGM 1381 TaxID=3047085 RepID=UPI0024B7D866|nr:sugar ABC transporter ATP-binding protein [Rhodococcus sp. IEGM 1381]MDI9894582.1 sugar ABC transporter ATP-binding protein [Rhodococcus sp. IEGM 1381]